ncbi:GWxTD domain-containing protein [Hymenobacter daecheongensis DSM 21074]|uniref:GWxTD domain-containing protein n=1 Tax=Hymenobacter daecheongensis DSM 21074 TaxID=1121955 RepID=A0A1M6CUJ4_9BACT|nr:GWxTD domain-containing protein [Hymenobacter daecheongensis]SHI64755.1 GWxTD domain-containing protein [Hymenobacter daecheongensis DSM 21074]
MKTPLLFLLLLLLWAPRPAAAQRRDFAGLYAAQRRLQLDTRREADSLHFYVRFADGSVLRRGHPLRLAAWAGYEAKRPLWQDTVPRLGRRIRPAGAASWVEFSLPAARLRPGQVLSLHCGPADEAAAGPDGAWLLLTPERLGRAFILTDSVGDPLLRPFIHSGEAVRVDSYGSEQPVTAKLYSTAGFAAALPPMADPATQPPAPRTLGLLDSLFFRAGQELRLRRPGLYALRVGDAPRPLALLVEENEFPALKTADDLIRPLIYLTTSAERQKLYNAPNPKHAVDDFWLSIARDNQPVARQLIRTYYGRVADANRLFSAHKAGWMTDRGLLYVVLGPPEAVYRTATEERWVYRGTERGTATYTFRPKPSTFAPEHYELVRRPEHELLWYAAVEQWRKALTAPTAR